MKLSFSVLLFIILFSGCTNSIDTGEFNKEAWKADVKGCTLQRQALVDEIDDLKLKLLGLHHKKIVRVLGSPEERELSKRSQNYYSYFIDPAPSCETSTENPRKLVIRFTALGIANEVSIR